MHADPPPTESLPSRCSDADAESAWETVEECRALRQARVAVQQPFAFNYTLEAASRPGPGFYGLERTHS